MGGRFKDNMTVDDIYNENIQKGFCYTILANKICADDLNYTMSECKTNCMVSDTVLITF